MRGLQFLKSLAKEKKINTRQEYITKTLELVAKNISTPRFNFIEVGCMFKENEGLSTYTVTDFIKKNRLKARFISIDADREHIESCKRLLWKFDPELIPLVEFRCAESTGALPEILKEMGEVHLALLDGGAHPEVCLKEFEIVNNMLSKGGIILVDDLARLEPTIPFPGERPFGKCTLIYPMLIIADYLKYRRERMQAGNLLKPGQASAVLASVIDQKSITEFKGNFAVLKCSVHHAMLAYSDSPAIEELKASKFDKS